MKKIIGCKKEIIIYFFALLITGLFFGNNIIQYQGKKAALIILLSITAAVIVLTILSKIFVNMIGQLAMGLIPFYLFIAVSVLFNNDKWNYESNFSKKLIICFGIYTFVLVISLIDMCSHYNNNKVYEWIKRNRVMLIVMVIICVSRIPFMNLLQRWDAGEYYYRMGLALENFDYSGIDVFFDNYGLCGHSASLFCMIYMIGEMIYSGHIIGVSIINLILTAITMWCVYKIIIKLTSSVSRTLCAIYTLIISFAPIVYTFTMHLNLDYTMAMFVIMVICSYMYEKPLLTGILSIICFQTKENALVVVAGIALGEIIRHILKYRKQSLKVIFTDLRLYATLAAALVQWMYFRLFGNNWVATGEQEAGGLFKWNNNGSECLGFNPSFIIMKFKQQCILNFNWIPVLIIITGTIYIVFNHKKLKKNGTYMICPVIGALVTHSLFSYLYITGTCTRYNIISDILIYIIAIYVINKVKEIYDCKHDVSDNKVYNKARKILDSVLLCLWCMILVMECFITIDPLSNLVFLNADSVTRDTLIMTMVNDEMTYGESLIHNTQYHGYDKSMDIMLKNTDYDPDTTDIYLYDDDGVFICGNVPLYYLNWDIVKKKRVFYSNNNTKKMNDYHLISTLAKKGEKMLKDNKLKEKALFVVTTYYVDRSIDINYSLDVLNRYYDISERKTASTYHGGIYYYELTLK